MRSARALNQGSRHVRLTVLSLLSMAAVLIIPAYSQSTNGALHGTVTDSTGALVPGAMVRIRNLQNDQLRTARTDDHGFYAIAALAPGHYSETVSGTGFQTITRPDVEVQVSQDLQLDATLSVGRNTTVVQVTSAPPMLETASATLGQTIGSRDTVDLPLNGRQFTQLLLLTPGAAPVQGGQQSFYTISFGAGGISPSVNGQLADENVFTIDGILNTHPFIESWAISPPPDAIQEFKSESHIADAEFSLSSGANINLVTKSGTDQFHGDVWEFVRNQALDAANFFDNYTGTPKPSYVQNQYGATFGGPVILPWYNGVRHKTHFFGYYEGFRSDEGFTALTNVPPATELSGDFSDLLTGKQATDASGDPLSDALGRPIMVGQLYNPYSTRTVNGQLVRDPIPGNNINSVMTPDAAALTYLQALYPSPNYGPGGNSFPNNKSATDQSTRSNQFGIGADHTFANNDTFFGKFFYSQPNMTGPSAVKFGAEQTENHARVLATSYTHLFSPTLLMTLHYGYSWLYYDYTNQPAGAALMQATNTADFIPVQNGIDLVPQITINPRLGSPDSGGAFSQYAIAQGPMRSHQFNVDVQKVHGAHTLGTGFLFMHLHAYDNGWGASVGFDQYPSSAIAATGTNVTSTGDGLASMLLDLPTSYGTTFGNTGADLTTNWIGAYVQDKWQISKRLNLQLGLRWDFQAPPHYKNNQFAMWNSDCPMGNYTTATAVKGIEQQCLLLPFSYLPAATPGDPDPATWPQPNVRSSIWAPQYDGWQPRVGFSYAATRSLVVRGGFNVFDDHNAFDKETQDPRGSYPVGGSVSPTSLNLGFPSVKFDALPSVDQIQGGSGLSITRAGNPNAKIPYIFEYNVGTQQQLGQNTSLELDYLGSVSRHLWGTYGYNQPLPSQMGSNAIPGGQPFPFIAGVIQADDNIFSSNYNALEAELTRRYANGFMFIASYTYSHCLNVFGGEYDSWPQDTYNLSADYGACDANIPQLFSFSPVYQLPFGQGHHIGGSVGKFVNSVVAGWSLTNITSIHSGTPFSVTVPFDNANVGHTGRASYVAGCNLKPQSSLQSLSHWYNPGCFAVPAAYTFGDTSRNGYRGPDYVDFDLGVFKTFSLGEARSLEVRAEGYNIANHTNLSNPQTSIGETTFMQILSANSAREIQLAGKFVF